VVQIGIVIGCIVMSFY